MFYDNLNALCKSNGTTVTAVLKELKISTSKGTAWKSGAVPKGGILSKLADYFNVSTDYLLGNTDNPQSARRSNQQDLTPDEEKLLNFYRSLNNLGKEEAQKRVNELAQLEQYKRSDDNFGIDKKATPIYRAARSQDNTEQHEIIEDGKSIIEKLSKIPPVTKKEDF